MTTKVFQYDARIAAIHMLRVNLKSLVAEARIIRFEEKRAGIVYQWNLYDHRVKVLREELRYTGLALAFVRHRPYRSVERLGSKDVDVKRLAKKVAGKWPFEGTLDNMTDWMRG